MRRFGTVMRSGQPSQSTTRFWDFHAAAADHNRHLRAKKMENQSKT